MPRCKRQQWSQGKRMITIPIAKKIIAIFSKDSGIRKDVIIKNIDKIYPLGKLDLEGKQLRIVKPTNDSFKKTNYRRHKNRIKNFTFNQRQKKLPITIKSKI